MSSLFGYFMGALLIVIGGATALFAPRVGPNPFFGVRTGYSYANRQVWDQSNRVGGWLMAGIGALLLAVTGVLQALGVGLATATVVLSTTLVVTLLGGVAWLFWYTRRLALGSATAMTFEPISLDWRMLAPGLIGWALLAVTMAALYPTFPEILVTHFSAADQPNGWSSRGSFALFYTGLGLLLAVIPVIIAQVARYEPVIGVSRMNGWYVEPQQGIRLTSWIMGLTNVFLLVILVDLAWYNWNGHHVIPLGPLVVVSIVLLLGGIVALFFRYARRSQP